jgi:hypothetical protein
MKKVPPLHLFQCSCVGAFFSLSIAVAFGIAFHANERFARIFLAYTLPSLAFVGAGAGAAAGYIGHRQGYDQALSDLGLKLVNLPEEPHADPSQANPTPPPLQGQVGEKMA